MAGYGGGPKIIMPGVCDFEYIRDHHMENVKHPKSIAGTIKGNPFHEGILEVAKAVGLDLSINCVYNQKGEVIKIIAGNLETAFEEAVDLCFEKLGYRFEEKVDITITSTYPHTHGHQIFKGLHTPDIITKESGAILLIAPIVSPIPTDFLNSINTIKEKSNQNPVQYVKDALSKGIPILPDKPMDFNMAMSTMFLRPKIRTILVSKNSSKEVADKLGFEFATSIEDGLRLLKREFPKARVAVFPTGGLIVPITSRS
jgi:nickel-dependent lactate racemase